MMSTTERVVRFDVEKAKAGKPIVTRDGRAARIVGYDPDVDCFCVAVTISGKNKIDLFTRNGHFHEDEDESDNDLFMVQQTQTSFLRVHPISEGFAASADVLYVSAEVAEAMSVPGDIVATVQIPLD